MEENAKPAIELEAATPLTAIALAFSRPVASFAAPVYDETPKQQAAYKLSSSFTGPSPTICTKEAMAEINAMFGKDRYYSH